MNKFPVDSLYTDRNEDKYICDLKDINSIFDAIEEYLDPYYPKKDTDYVNVSSTYLDTPDLKFLWQHLNEDEDKQKVRVRQYGPNNDWQQEKFLEIKYRDKGVKKKCRVSVDARGIIEALGGEKLSNMKKLNPEMPTREYDECTHLIEQACKDGVTPILKVTYTRYSYKGKGIRVTIDKDIKATALAALKEYDLDKIKNSDKWADFENCGTLFGGNNILVEIKYPTDGEIPDWLKKLMDKYSTGKDEPFSKYIYGIYQELV